MAEIPLEKWAKKQAKAQGVLMYKFKSPAKRGVPDDVLFYQGCCILMEFKTPKGTGRLSPLQAKK